MGGGRAGPTFHAVSGRGGRTVGAKRSIRIEIGGLSVAVRVDPARPHDVRLPERPDVRAVVADRAYRGLARLAARRNLALEQQGAAAGGERLCPAPPAQPGRHAFAQLGRWRRLTRCSEGAEASARAWLEVAAMGYLFVRLRLR